MSTLNETIVTTALLTAVSHYGFGKSWKTSLITGVASLAAIYVLERVFYPPANAAPIAVGMEKIPANGSGPGLVATTTS